MLIPVEPRRINPSILISYKNINEFWQVEVEGTHSKKAVQNPIGGKDNWYQNADKYWSKTEASVNGVLGGLEFLHDLDIVESDAFLKEFYGWFGGQRGRVLDCGAGIGSFIKLIY